jgi:CO dehydrogenase/acetyl-CoA synthase gamma subunit (corrinoid Fe-S protein)
MSIVLPRMWKNSTHDISDPVFTTTNSLTYHISEDAHRWSKNLRNKILIIDIDSRLDTEEGGMLNSTSPTAKNMLARTGGYLNHMLYGKIHAPEPRPV